MSPYEAGINPAHRFRRPMEVVGAVGMTVLEKLAILRAWEADERALQRAEDEGMGGGEHAHLQRVQEALACLHNRHRYFNPAARYDKSSGYEART